MGRLERTESMEKQRKELDEMFGRQRIVPALEYEDLELGSIDHHDDEQDDEQADARFDILLAMKIVQEDQRLYEPKQFDNLLEDLYDQWRFFGGQDDQQFEEELLEVDQIVRKLNAKFEQKQNEPEAAIVDTDAQAVLYQGARPKPVVPQPGTQDSQESNKENIRPSDLDSDVLEIVIDAVAQACQYQGTGAKPKAKPKPVVPQPGTQEANQENIRPSDLNPDAIETIPESPVREKPTDDEEPESNSKPKLTFQMRL